MKYLGIVLTVFLMFSFMPSVCFAQEYPAIEDPAAERADDMDPISENIIDEDNPKAPPEAPILPIPAETTPLSQKPNPRIMVITVEYIDGIEQPAGIAQAKMEKEFLASNFPLMDKSQMEMVKERDAVFSFSDPDRAASLGRSYGAEIVVIAEVKSNMTDMSQPYGAAVYAYECDAAAKAVKTDTAQIITSHSAGAKIRGSGRISTANKACEKAISEIAAAIVGDISEETGGDACH